MEIWLVLDIIYWQRRGRTAMTNHSLAISRFWKIINFISFGINRVSFCRRTYFFGKVLVSIEKYAINKIEYPTIILGSNVTFNSGMKYNPIGGDERVILRTINNGKIYIGNHVGISNSSIVAYDEVRIGDNVLLGGGVKIYDCDFHSKDFELRTSNNDLCPPHAPVSIKNGAFVGGHSIILKGVTIGEKSIIGAGSVVSCDIPDGQIWAGNPAKFIGNI